MKIDIEGYECKVDITHITSNQKYVWIIVKALQPEILMNKRGKFIPFIFIEWGTLYTRQEAVCPEYNDWVQLFVKGGYQPANAGMSYAVQRKEEHGKFSYSSLTFYIWSILHTTAPLICCIKSWCMEQETNTNSDVSISWLMLRSIPSFQVALCHHTTFRERQNFFPSTILHDTQNSIKHTLM